MKLELISFKLCPFVQSSVITLLHKGIDYKITYIDVHNPPQWFDELSPTGQVPILKVDDEHIIFESAVINEYLDDISSGGMMPDDPLSRALNRAWTQFCGSILSETPDFIGAKDEEALQDIEYDILEKLDRVEAQKTDEIYFNGSELNLIDTSYAGLFMRLNILKPARDILDGTRFPKLNKWSDNLLGLETVQKSVVAEFPEIYTGMIRTRDGLIAKSF